VVLIGRLVRLVWGGDVDRALRPVLAIQLAGSLAWSTAFPFLGIWAITHLGASQSTLGTAMLVGAVLAAASGYAGGHLSDHIGRRPLILASWTGSALLPLGFLLVGQHEWPGLALIALLPAVGAFGQSADQAMVADLVPPERHEAGFAAVRVTSNLGVTLGPPLGGLLLLVGSWHAVFVGVAAMAIAGLAVAVTFLPRTGAYAPVGPPERQAVGAILRDRPFLVFLVSASLAWLVYVAYETVLPISLTTSHGLSPSAWGLLMVINPALVTVLQMRLTRWTERYSAALKLAVALPLMGLPFLLLLVSTAIPMIALVLVLFVFGEMLWVPASQSVVTRLAPADIRGAYLGAFGMMGSAGWALAPFVGLHVRAAGGDTATWTLFAAISVVAALTGAVAAAGAVRRPAAVASAAR
jgi:predicted MFS family arabinose efflux permease